MIIFPNAKINLGLNVVEKRPDGYHNLETIFYPINLQDALEVKRATNVSGDSRIKIKGTPINGLPEDNLVMKAYHLLNQQYSLPPVDVCLFKHIPTEAGLGGGSSDCAFMIKLLNTKFELGLSLDEMEMYAAKLGADCAFFIRNEPVFATGIGNVFQSIDLSLSGYHLVLVKPDLSVSTRDAFSNICPHKPALSLKEVAGYPVETWKEYMVNDFEESIFSKYPAIAELKEKLYRLGAVYASMSGSGSAVYGIFRNKVDHVDTLFPGLFCRQREMI